MVSGRQARAWLNERVHVLRHDSLFTFLFGVVAVAVFLQFWVDSTGTGTVLTIVFVVLLGYGLFRLWRDKGRQKHNLTVQPKPGLVIIASSGDLESSAAKAAIQYHFRGENNERDSPTLNHLWIIHSRKFEPPPKKEHDQACETKGPPKLPSFELARALEKYFDDLHPPGNVVLLEIKEPDNPYEVFEKAILIYERARMLYQISPDDIVADVTGGTKSMSIGLALACLPQSRSLQFMKPREYNEEGGPVVGKGSVPVAIDLDWFERRGYVSDSG